MTPIVVETVQVGVVEIHTDTTVEIPVETVATVEIEMGPPGPPGTGVPGPSGAGADEVRAELTGHIDDTTPHPAYDDLPSLKLLFENGLV